MQGWESLLNRLSSRVWLGFIAVVVLAIMNNDSELLKWAYLTAAGVEGARDVAESFSGKKKRS